jgi:hypothetical protein
MFGTTIRHAIQVCMKRMLMCHGYKYSGSNFHDAVSITCPARQSIIAENKNRWVLTDVFE